MPVPALSAARTLCELRGWRVSNLELQKILYIAQMLHLGRTGLPLLRENFEAWEYGPVVPEVYHRAKGFGSDPVRNVFHWEPSVSLGSPEWQSLSEAAEATAGLTAGRLVAITHWDDGAWAQCFQTGVRGSVIPNDLIMAEYHAREAASI